MSASAVPIGIGDALAQLETAVDELAAASLTAATDDSVLDAWRRLEVVRRRLDPVEHRIIAQVNERSLAEKHACRTVTNLARQLLHLHPAEAHARVQAAEVLGPRQATSGEPLEPTYPLVAEALADGAISSRHARVITQTIEDLPAAARAQWSEKTEKELTDLARECDPKNLGVLARRLAYDLDQDGQYRDASDADRRRELNLRRGSDGSGKLSGELTPECAEHLATWLDAHAKPVNVDDAPDLRSAGQRRHDALLDLLKAATRTGLAARSGGCTTTVVLTMDLDAYATGVGTATTGHGYPVPADVAKAWAGGDARIMTVLLSAAKGIEAYSTTQRLFSEHQRLAMIARDGGCSFPGCDAPPQFCEADHVTEHQHTGRTSVDNGTLLCAYHHRHAKDHDWTCQMINGRPWWKPPKWLDQQQRPRRNTMHDRPG